MYELVRCMCVYDELKMWWWQNGNQMRFQIKRDGLGEMGAVRNLDRWKMAYSCWITVCVTHDTIVIHICFAVWKRLWGWFVLPALPSLTFFTVNTILEQTRFHKWLNRSGRFNHSRFRSKLKMIRKLRIWNKSRSCLCRTEPSQYSEPLENTWFFVF